jgi:hypothetical protein
MSDRRDNQDVGLEAATIQRVRNSSLVKWSGADNSTGLKLGTEATDFSSAGVVGERSHAGEAAAEASRGGMGSENAGMSNERGVRNSSAECLRVPE